jgi:hypothetical protein
LSSVELVQFLEVVRIEGHAFSLEDIALACDMYLLQVKLCACLVQLCVFLKFLVVRFSQFSANNFNYIFEIVKLISSLQWN